MPLEEWLALDPSQYILRDALIEIPEVEEPRPALFAKYMNQPVRQSRRVSGRH